MKRLILAIALACAALLAGASTARAFIGGSGTDSSVLLLPGVCSVTGALCGPTFAPCPLSNPVPPAPAETCLGFSYSSTFTQNGTSGESSAVQSGFYECKAKSKLIPVVKNNEDTLLVLVNEDTSALCACIVLFDGHTTQVSIGLTDLPVNDVDEINLCVVTPAPPAGGVTGKVEVVTATGACAANPFTSFEGGAYAWIKDVVYKGTKANSNDPFSAKAVAIGKTELRVTPGGVESGSSFTAACAGAANFAVSNPSAYIENTLP